MKFLDKYFEIEKILNPYISSIEIPNESLYPKNYRNRCDLELSSNINNDYTSIFSINFTKKLKEYLHTINNNNFKLLEVMIKENNKNQILVKIVCYIYNYNTRIKLKSLVVLLLYIAKMYNKELVSVYYQYTNNNSKPKKNSKYIHLYGYKDIVESYNLDNRIIKFHIEPDSFSRINYVESINIYNHILSLVLKNLDYKLVCLGRDINVPSLLLSKYFKSTRIFTHCKLIYNDLLKNTYKEDHKISLTSKVDYKDIFNIDDDIILLSAGRNGVSDEVMDRLNNLDNIKQIVYISCNSKSMKRNIDYLLTKDSKYKIDRVVIVDEFPNTKYTNILISLKSISFSRNNFV